MVAAAAVSVVRGAGARKNSRPGQEGTTREPVA